jgi:hypothetical protein
MNWDDRFYITSMSAENDCRTIIDVFINELNTFNLHVSVPNYWISFHVHSVVLVKI